MLVAPFIAAAVVLFLLGTLGRLIVLNQNWGGDFHAGIWPAARDLLQGTSPFPPPSPHLLFALKNAFVTPPALAVPAIPLAHLPFSAAVAIWDVADGIAFIAGLWLLGLRNWRLYVLAVASYPMADALYFGQPDGIFVLLLALAWRYRDDLSGALAVGAIVALKLIMWPLLLWLIVRRRYRMTALALSAAVVLLVASWALIDFRGMLQYPRLLEADVRAFEGWGACYSFVSLAIHLGVSRAAAEPLGIAAATLIALSLVWIGRATDQAWYVAAVVAGLFVSPLVWIHYLLVVFVLLAAFRPTARAPWLATLAMWVAFFHVSYGVRLVAVVAPFLIVAVSAARASGRPAGRVLTQRSVYKRVGVPGEHRGT